MGVTTKILGKIHRAPNTLRKILLNFLKSVQAKLSQSNRISGRVYRYFYRELKRIADKELNSTYTKIAKSLAKKNQLKVAFLVAFESTWKLDSLYREMERDPRFNPIILICPVVNYGYDNMLYRLNSAFSYFHGKGYQTLKLYNEQSNDYIDICGDMSPDIIFYTNPYKELVDERYYIANLSPILGCYVSYGYINIATTENFSLPFHNLLWKFYLENDSIKDYYDNELGLRRFNHKVVGYPLFDSFHSQTSKYKSNKYKYVIWAPHHTLDSDFDGLLHRNSFLWMHDFMIELTEKYKDQLFIIFRPHPLLKNKLYLHPQWGKEKTDSYYHLWESMDNTSLSESGDYIDDFALSDAMIHDCGSFTIEYLYTEKPVLFTGPRPPKDTLVPSANEALDCYQFAQDAQGVEVFLQDLIMSKEDSLIQKKREYKKRYLISPNGKTAAQNIIDDIVNSIWN